MTDAARPATSRSARSGSIRTPFTTVEGTPIQSVSAVGVAGWIDLEPGLVDGLDDIEGFSHLILLYHLHRAAPARLTVTPFLDDRPHGIFATRSPTRPNALGLSTVRLLGIAGARLDILDVDMLDGTPLLDIKPYVPAFDDRADARIGWFTRTAGPPRRGSLGRPVRLRSASSRRSRGRRAAPRTSAPSAIVGCPCRGRDARRLWHTGLPVTIGAHPLTATTDSRSTSWKPSAPAIPRPPTPSTSKRSRPACTARSSCPAAPTTTRPARSTTRTPTAGPP